MMFLAVAELMIKRLVIENCKIFSHWFRMKNWKAHIVLEKMLVIRRMDWRLKTDSVKFT